ncbi:hypothetical protein D3C86_1542030 [compost metagenome]
MVEAALAPARIGRRASDQRLKGRRRLAQIGQHLADRQMANLIGPLHVRLFGVQVVIANDARPRFLIQARRNLRALRIVDAVQPDKEQIARHAARVPIALFLEAADLTDPGGGGLRNHGGVGGVVLGRQR